VSTKFLSLEPWALPNAGNRTNRSVLDVDWIFARIRTPLPEVRAELTSRGFFFRDSPKKGILRKVLSDGALLLRMAPGLEAAVNEAVDEIVLLRARPAFDISHSEPRWPHTIFVSAPSKSGSVSALRAIESIIHEAMHLQLTCFEIINPLVSDEDSKMESPWREEPRHLRGVLHGVYVFRCVGAFFARPDLLNRTDAIGASHIRQRCEEMDNELSRVDLDRLALGLSLLGREFLRSLTQ